MCYPFAVHSSRVGAVVGRRPGFFFMARVGYCMTQNHDSGPVCAQKYHDLGFRILRISGKYKSPISGGFGADWPDFTHPPRDFCADDRIALMCGPCPALGDDWLACFDLDHGMTIEDVAERIGPLPATLSSKGKAHFYFRVTPGPHRDQLMQWTDVLRTKKKRNDPAMDLKWAGGYAIEPGSWDVPFSAEAIATLPVECALKLAEIKGVAGKKARETSDIRKPLGEMPADLLQALARHWPQPGEGCHEAALALGGILADSHWSEGDIADFADHLFDHTGTTNRTFQVLYSVENRREDPTRAVKGIPALKELLAGSTDEVNQLINMLRSKVPGLKPPSFDIEEIAALQTKAEQRLQKVEVAKEVAVGAAKAAGRVMLLKGSQIEVAEHIIDDHLQGCVYAEGEIWRPAPDKIWRAVPGHILSGWVDEWDGTEYLTAEGRASRFLSNDGNTKGVIKKLQARLSDSSFFADAPVGAAFKGETFVGLKGPEPLTVEHRARYCCPWEFQPTAKPLETVAAMRQWFAGCADADDRILCLFEQMGVSLLGAGHLPGFHRGLMLTGEGANGKSVALDLLQGILPPGACSAVAPQDFGDEQSRASLVNKLANIVSDIPETTIMASGHLKRMFSHEADEAKVVFKAKFTFKPKCTYTFSANALPPTDDHSKGFWRRWIVVGFPNTFEGARAEADLTGRLLGAEAGALASFAALAGLVAIRRGGLTMPASSGDALMSWRLDSDQIACFVNDVDLRQLPAAMPQVDWMPSSTLYESYTKWAESMTYKPVMRKNFIKRLTKLGFREVRPAGKGRAINASLGGPVLAAVTPAWAEPAAADDQSG